MKTFFRHEVLALLAIPDYPTFHDRIIALNSNFPLLGSWFKWYLNNTVVTHLFSACRNLNKDDEKRFSKLKKDTNAQEGLGGLLQFLHSRRTDGLYYIMETIFQHIKMSDKNTKLGFCGVQVNYHRATAEQKKRGREPKSSYKAPESYSTLIPGPKRVRTDVGRDKNDLSKEVSSIANLNMKYVYASP